MAIALKAVLSVINSIRILTDYVNNRWSKNIYSIVLLG